MKLDFIPFSPIAFPPDLEWLLVHPQYYMLAGGIMLALVAAWLFVRRGKVDSWHGSAD